MIDFFATAETTQTTKSKDKVKAIVPVDAGGSIARLNSVREQIAQLKAQEALLLDDIKPVAVETFIEQFKERKVRPESFVMQDTDGAKVLLIVQDKYAKLTDATHQTLKELYPKKIGELVQRTTEFKFNQDILDAHGPVITKAISEAIASMPIPDNDKKKLLKATVTETIKKGTIERLHTYKEFPTLFSLIKPTIQFKNQGESEE
jgi:hypothetical protein